MGDRLPPIAAALPTVAGLLRAAFTIDNAAWDDAEVVAATLRALADGLESGRVRYATVGPRVCRCGALIIDVGETCPACKDTHTGACHG